MRAKLKSLYSLESFKTEEDKQAARILYVLIFGSLITFLVTFLGGLYWQEQPIIITGIVGFVLQIVPLGLLARRQVQASSFVVGIISLILVTFATTTGQGIHDIAIMAYPVIIIIASLIMHRNFFVFFILMSIISIGWLVYGEAKGLFIRHEILTPSWADFLIMVTILMVAALAVYMQATRMRENLQLARQEIARRKNTEEQLRHLGTHDILTGIYNRLFFEEELARLERSRDYPISVIVSDLDNLKETNDSLGHSMGDELLKRASRAFGLTFREGDVLARIGGDEFAVLLPKTDANVAGQILQRIRDRIAENNASFPDLPVRLSLGVATAEKGNLVQAFTHADQRMYAEKATRKTAQART
jgi:diguanylate cyclase (GGDEF)-like protein